MSSARPRAVEGGFWLWVLAGAGLVVLGLLGLTLPRDGVRAQLLAAGLSTQRVEAYLQLMLVQGVLAVPVAWSLGSSRRGCAAATGVTDVPR